jgi:peptidoglycan/xylan/chitin deacetylase (PgdA/CDA1 family)
MSMRWTDAAARVASSRAADVVVGALERAHRGAPGTLAVLTYHRIDHPDARPDLQSSLLSATPADFEAQMSVVASRWRPVSIDEVLEARRSARASALPARSVLVTVDDAYQDFAAHAWPVLRRLGVPVVLFVATGFPDRPDRSYWWDDLHHALATTSLDRLGADSPIGATSLASAADRRAAFRALRAWFKATPHGEAVAGLDALLSSLGAGPRRSAAVLGWDELRRLASEGVALGAHSVTHAMLDRLPGAASVVEEVRSSRAELASRTGCDLPVFAYPSGQHDDVVVEATEAAGIEVAFTTLPGHNRLASADWLRLRRINVSARMPPAAVRAQLLPVVDRLRSWRARGAA